jgi:hypothetical protein
MKTKILFALFITITVLLSGCGKTDTKLESENAALKARVQKLEQQLKASATQTASPASSGSETASLQALQSQLDEAQKQAAAAADELKSANSQVEAQKAQIDQLTRELSDAQQARDKAEQALKLYQDKATSALKEFKALRSTLSGTTTNLDGYHQNYLATRTAVANLVNELPESQVKRGILGVLATFTRVNEVWQAAGDLMQERTKEAQADYDKFVDFGGLGPNQYVVKMGKDKILAPAEQANAAMVSVRDEKMVSYEKDIDQGIKNLQALVNENGA